MHGPLFVQWLPAHGFAGRGASDRLKLQASRLEIENSRDALRSEACTLLLCECLGVVCGLEGPHDILWSPVHHQVSHFTARNWGGRHENEAGTTAKSWHR
eukprot:797790-Amphidinium_carterae.1